MRHLYAIAIAWFRGGVNFRKTGDTNARRTKGICGVVTRACESVNIGGIMREKNPFD